MTERGHQDYQMVLAMSYVPWQCWEDTFEADEALQRGTAFPSLELPFFKRGGCR